MPNQNFYNNFSLECFIKLPKPEANKILCNSWHDFTDRGCWSDPAAIGLLMDNFQIPRSNIQDNNWYYLVATVAPQGNEYLFNIYVDGQLDNTYTSSGGVIVASRLFSTIKRNNPVSWPYKGWIKDLGLSSCTLTPEEIYSHYEYKKNR